MAAAPGFLDAFSPWTSRSITPKPSQKADEKGSSGSPGHQQGGDHHINQHYRINPRDYPDDCPPLNVRWFYAVDVPKRKPLALARPGEKPKELALPKKFAAFTNRDSWSIEAAFQKLADAQEAPRGRLAQSGDITEARNDGSVDTACKGNTTLDDGKDDNQDRLVKVPVNEDFLFDVEIDKRELAPAYWLGPVYHVKRATWFYDSGASSRPCDENLALQLEEGYIKAKPWRYEPPPPVRSSSQKAGPKSWVQADAVAKNSGEGAGARAPSADDINNRKPEDGTGAAPAPPKFQLQTHRLFGTYMNSVVTYQDATTAWLLTDDFLSRMSSSMYQRFAGGGHLGGVKVVRGFAEAAALKTAKADSSDDSKELYERGRTFDDAKRQPVSANVPSIGIENAQEAELQSEVEYQSQTKMSQLEQRMATLVGSPGSEDPAVQEEEVRQREEKEIQDDYREMDGDEQGREIEHLVLVTHGIGQRLGLKLESLNFIHDVNVLRKTLKTVYDNSPDLQALNSQVDKLPKNCRVQVLPIVWRHLLDFPKQSFTKERTEQDLSDVDALGADLEYPMLSDITVEGVPAIRNLVEDLFLDILLYQSAYREFIAGIVQRECNRVYKLFLQRNPQFHGKVSLIGHSLGSAIFFDLLCRQRGVNREPTYRHRNSNIKKPHKAPKHDDSSDLSLDFEVEDLYCLGSPIGLFQMLKGRTVAGRTMMNEHSAEFARESDSEPFLHASTTATSSSHESLSSVTVSSPKCSQLYNIFHPTDPVAYRIEPLISPAMKTLKPQPLPYVKRGIFGVPGTGLTNIGARVGQSVSGFWSNITTGVASSLLNRSLGLSHNVQSAPYQNRTPLSMTTVTNVTGAGAISGPEAAEEDKKRKAGAASGAGEDAGVEHPATLIDTEIETLYSGFHRRTKSAQSAQSDEEGDIGGSAEWQEVEDKAKQLRREEEKVRALNSNGRVDYSIQEGVFDISLIASIASHLSYWADEDVSHFMISQLLSRQRVIKR